MGSMLKTVTRARQSDHRLAEISGSKAEDVLAPRMELECLSVYQKKKKKKFRKGPGTKNLRLRN